MYTFYYLNVLSWKTLKLNSLLNNLLFYMHNLIHEFNFNEQKTGLFFIY